MTTETTATQETPAEQRAKTICFNVTIGTFRTTKSLSTNLIKVDADKDQISASKRILESDLLKQINSLDTGYKNWLKQYSLPSLFKDGMYLLPIALIERVDARTTKYLAERAAAVVAFMEWYRTEYDNGMENQKAKLRTVHNENDYPGPAIVSSRFYVQTQYLSVDIPAVLKKIKGDIWKREYDRAQSFWLKTQEMASAKMRDEFKTLVDHLNERLTGAAEDGKPKKFKNTLVTNVQEWLELFQDRNIASDAELQSVVEQARKLIDGVHPEDVRTDEALREQIAMGFVSISAAADQLVEDKPKRAIAFEED